MCALLLCNKTVYILYIDESVLLWACSVSQLKRIPPHCLEDLRGVYSQLEVFTCSRSLSSLEVTHTLHRFLFLNNRPLCVWVWASVIVAGATVSVWGRPQLCTALAGAAHPQLQLQRYSLPGWVTGKTLTHAPAHWFIYSLTLTFSCESLFLAMF